MLGVLIFGCLALTVFGAATAPDCNKEINDAATCFIDMMKDQVKKMNDTYNSHKADIDTCLKSAGCDLKEDPKKDQKKQCFQQVVPKVKSSVETCLKSSKFPDLKVPDIKFDFDDMPVDPLKLLNQSCPNPDATKKAFECIGKLFNTGDSKTQMAKDIKQFCDTEKNCKSKVSGPCMPQFNETMKCGMKAQSEIKSLTADIAECKGVDLGEKSGEKSDEKNGKMENMCEMINKKPPTGASADAQTGASADTQKGASADAHKTHEMKPAKANDAGTQKPHHDHH